MLVKKGVADGHMTPTSFAVQLKSDESRFEQETVYLHLIYA